ncbi:hypothetical protein GCM10008967_35830 [Bacillus carboniphilus]|uniref:Glycogen biosynthesis protein GlgD n=1 Tax=Bacillus carboniphilus TaxID=86663 RepID=A0ABN0WMX5_9BACI
MTKKPNKNQQNVQQNGDLGQYHREHAHQIPDYGDVDPNATNSVETDQDSKR